jgi:hypothetical protein
MPSIHSNLHMHSFYSDGVFSPTELARWAKSKGWGLVSLTDHNSVSGLRGFASALLEGKPLLVPGVELTCGFDSSALDKSLVLHLLAYFPPQVHETPLLASRFVEKRFDGLCKKIRREVNKRRATQIRLLVEAGLNISFSEVFKDCLKRSPPRYPTPEITTADIACALVKRNSIGFVEAKSSLSFGKRFYVGIDSGWNCTDIGEIIGAVKDFGGITSLAHPLKKIPERGLEGALRELKELGLDAVEALNKCTPTEAVRVARTAKKLSLKLTTGNDFHRELSGQTDGL